MYRIIKTHKESNPAKIITSVSGTAVQNLSIFVEKCLLPEVLKIDTRIQFTQHMLNMIDELNQNGNLHGNCVLVSFDVVICSPASTTKWESNQ